MRALIFFTTLLFSTTVAWAQGHSYSAITQLLQSRVSLQNLESRAQSFSQEFVGRPYLENGPLGEGPGGRFDQDPLYRFDGFDCTTYIETVMALTRSFTAEQFELTLQQIRYQNGRIQYQDRNHFVELDWNPNNERAGFIRDITQELALPETTQDVTQVFSKRGWYRAKKQSDLRVEGLSPLEQQIRWKEWTQLGDAFLDQPSTLKILPGSTILQVKNLPTVGVLNVVRQIAGTKMVTHQALLLIDTTHATHDPDIRATKIRVRHASSKFKRVVDQSLEEFVQGQSKSSGYLGLNVLRVLP